MNADYYNAEPGYRSMDEMFWECERMREHPDGEEIDALHDFLDENSEPETADDIDDAYDRDREDDYEGEEDFE